MKTADYVSKLIKDQKEQGIPLSVVAWNAALACVGWAYVFGARGEYCDPTNRRNRASDQYPTIKSACKNFYGKDTVPAGCVGCKWFLGTAQSDESKHEGRTRFFDCRGFTYWVLLQLRLETSRSWRNHAVEYSIQLDGQGQDCKYAERYTLLFVCTERLHYGAYWLWVK